MTKGGLFQGRLSSFEPNDRTVAMPKVWAESTSAYLQVTWGCAVQPKPKPAAWVPQSSRQARSF